MTTFPADDPDKVPFAGILPAAAKPFVLGNGEGEKSLVLTSCSRFSSPQTKPMTSTARSRWSDPRATASRLTSI